MTFQSKKWMEEIANAVTHGIGAALSIAALIIMLYTVLTDHEGIWHILSATVYGISLILLYVMSTLYHSFFKLPRVAHVFKILDHSAIYVLIAGSYTPFLWIALRYSSGLAASAMIWLLAAVGIVWQCFNVHKFHIVSTLCYVAMGWISVLFLPQLMHSLSWNAMLWLIIGGLSYTIGTVFYLWKRLPFQHAIWHLFVLAGSAAHFYCIYYFVLPLAEA
ncbi:PAQR family membrane homeostasis protein TrhA [Megasphaera cerevisiae]|nr:hemolysin III family protein [Megasphaera cerevisiae]SJZ59786.1 hemolysin III [Megasphaera cerevisiae DSM 20462]